MPELFANLDTLAARLRQDLSIKKYVLLYAYNGTGKTRLSMAFKDQGKQGDARDTLYFNAFTEDLFYWDNDLDGDAERRLLLNRRSHFFSGIDELEMDNRIRRLLQRFADFDFVIDTEGECVRFSRTVERLEGGTIKREVVNNIKVSRGEENIFIWCFFLAVVEVAMDKDLAAYRWVKFVYIDDPISSLDEHNAIAVAVHLAQILKQPGQDLKTVISSHHALFFNVLHNEFKRPLSYFLTYDKSGDVYRIDPQERDTPFFHHVAALRELHHAAKSGRLYTYHFNMLRTILEKTARFHGLKEWSDCIKQDSGDPDGVLHRRLINILSHGNYSLYDPVEMMEENKEHFQRILTNFTNKFPFNPQLFIEEPAEA